MPVAVCDGVRVSYEDVGPQDVGPQDVGPQDVGPLEVGYRDAAPRNAASGGGVPLVLVHGWTADHHRWDRVVEALSTRRRCVMLDLPGHGDSDPPDDECSIDALARCVRDLADQLGIERMVLVGHSMGGMVALSLALSDPERVERLVLVDSVGTMLYSRSRALLVRASMALPFRAFQAINVRRAFTRNVPRDELRGHLARARRTPRSVVMGYYRAMMGFGVASRLADIRVPVLVVHGYRDVQFPISQALALAAALPDARLEVLDTGHEPPVETPEALTRAISRFVADLD